MRSKHTKSTGPLAVVSGAAGGLGFEFVRALSRLRYHVVMIDWEGGLMRRRRKELPPGAAIDYVEADVSAPEAYLEKLKPCLEGNLRILVNCAGIAKWAEIDSPENDSWARIVDVNLKGAYALTRYLTPGLKKLPCASIVNVASDSAETGFARRSAYCASKAGMVAFANALRMELKEFQVRVTNVFPARINTGFNGRILQPDKRYMAPGQVARLVVDMIARYPQIEIREIKLNSIHSSYGA